MRQCLTVPLCGYASHSSISVIQCPHSTPSYGSLLTWYSLCCFIYLLGEVVMVLGDQGALQKEGICLSSLFDLLCALSVLLQGRMGSGMGVCQFYWIECIILKALCAISFL